ncbi:hypothetical protein L3081_18730 [Colwellia sp. MSW7]|uniref:Uncharacterized protein n=1 Tax=Colwellia maritima TaxID=2912588 RepID=A0ABS9X5K3_9GAMM|nr:hypothetical protein [Colwellia maritima]MCI2285057.1 hypothetical protein [Colwellia maritima]
MSSIIPTFDNLNAMIANNPEIGISPELSKQVMNADFAPKYEAFANQGIMHSLPVMIGSKSDLARQEAINYVYR